MCNRQKITDPDELAEYRTRKRKEAKNLKSPIYSGFV